MRTISLTRGQSAIVSDADYDWLNQWKWFASFHSRIGGYYAARGIRKHGHTDIIKMHRLVVGAQPREIVDHKNRNPLDNRRENLRIVTARQSALNKRLLLASNKSGFCGVYWNSEKRDWRAAIRVNKHKIHLGCFDSPEDAARAYDAAALKYHEGFAPLNFPLEAGGSTVKGRKTKAKAKGDASL